MTTKLDYKRYAVLFVDDEEKSLKYFSRIFSNEFRIITSTNPIQAQTILEEKSDDIGVLVVDQRMPQQKGVDLLKLSREKYPYIVRLLTTAYTDLEDAIDAVNYGEIFRYITKPWDIENLYEHLLNAMNLFLAQQNERQLLKERREAMFHLAGNIAHELRTPLTSILSAVKGVDNYLPQLIEGYKKAYIHEKEISKIREIHLAVLNDALSDILSETKHSLAMIDILLMNISKIKIDINTTKIYSMKKSIIMALDRYPFHDEQKRLVEFDENNDFQYRGIQTLILHIFYNLLKNSLYAIAMDGNKGRISVRLKEGKESNKVFFKDTGSGIPKEAIVNIFDDFYSTKAPDSEGNIGIGLPFCRHVLEQFDAEIDCFSEEGVYTEFILTFPVIQNTEENNIPETFGINGTNIE